MASKERNALAELADWFGKMEERELPAYGYEKDFLCINYGKAKRIIAELANVKYYECLDGLIRADEEEIDAAFRNCRAIAEEGAKDEH